VLFLVSYLSLFSVVTAQTLQEWEARLQKEDPALVPILCSAGPEIIPLARKAIVAKNERLRGAGAHVLGKFKVVEELPRIASLLADPSWQVRCAALSALAHFPQEKVCGKIESALEDAHWQVRYSAVKQIGKLQCKSSVPLLHKILQKTDEHEMVLAAVCESLGKIGSPDSLPFLFESLKSPRQKVGLASDVALTQMARQYLPRFLEVLEDKKSDLELRRSIQFILGRLRAKSAIPLLYRLAKDTKEHGIIRYIALVLLADLEGTHALDIFWVCIEESNPDVKRGAVLALGKLRQAKGLPYFRSCLGADYPPLREASLWAITQLDIEITKPVILQALSDKNDLVAQGAIRLIGTLNITEAVPILVNMQPRPSLKNFVCWALETLQPLLPENDPNLPKILSILKEGQKK
jgi:HEAT repeat protein